MATVLIMRKMLLTYPLNLGSLQGRCGGKDLGARCLSRGDSRNQRGSRGVRGERKDSKWYINEKVDIIGNGGPLRGTNLEIMSPKGKVTNIHISLFESLFWDIGRLADYCSSSHKGLSGKKKKMQEDEMVTYMGTSCNMRDCAEEQGQNTYVGIKENPGVINSGDILV